jgi:DNA-binding protein YbaB
MLRPVTEGSWGDPDAAIARVEQQVREATERAQRARQLAAQMQSLVGRASSRNGEVTAAVTSSGALTEFSLSERAMDLDARSLERLVLATVNAAQRKVGEQAVALTADAFGEDSPVTARMREEAATRLPRADEGGSTLRWQ